MPVISWVDWYTMTFAVISVVFALVSLAYMIGIGFHLPKLQAWAKDEFYQALASAFIAVLLISFLSTVTATMTTLYGADPFGIANGYIMKVVDGLTSYFWSVIQLDFVFALAQGLAFKAMPSQIGFNYNPFAGMTTITSMLSLLMEAILGGMGLMYGQASFLSFIQSQLSIIFPVGLALRAFPFSRPAGGALIAIFLGFYIFYPFLWVFDNAIYDEVAAAGGPYSFQTSDAAGLGAACVDEPVKCITNKSDLGANALLGIIQGVGYQTIYYVFIFVFVLSMFNFIAALILINELAKIFGAEIDISGLSGLL